jgi:chaperone modulatory protein CbpM
MMDTSLTLVQCQLVDEHVTFSLAELSRVCGAERELVLQLVEHGVIEPIGPGPQSELFDAVGLQRMRTALRLLHDLELNLPGAALAMELLDRIAQLQRDRPGLGGVPGGP